MRSSKTLAIAGAAIAGLAMVSAKSAVAGDLAPPPILPPAPVVETLCCTNEAGWYLRGDISVGANVSDKHSLRTTPASATASGVVGYNDDLGASVAGGVGVGYAVNSWLRFDGTVEYRGGSKLSSVDYYGPNAANGFTTGKDFYSGNVSSVVGLVNGYVDLGTWYCLTPYIGGGVGVAYNRIDGFTDIGYSVPVPPGGTAGAYYKGGTSTNFAWALMAGVSYDVTSNLKLDLGYRYLNLGKAQTGSSVPQFGPPTYVYTQKDIQSHDVRLGMRWIFADKSAPPPPSYGSAPIVRKY
ncbi:MAG: outer membrane beta-barrel protein [Beijerinckiaceae bacterium]|nr:outer membrane beta-barrel protein [Beijerinckiaceae bacterium]